MEVGLYKMTWDGMNLVALSTKKSATFSAPEPIRSDANIDLVMAVALCLTESNTMQLMRLFPLLQTALYGQPGRNIPYLAEVDGSPRQISCVTDERERIVTLTTFRPDSNGTFRQHLEFVIDYYK